jgi:hypothetical protein
MADSTQTLDLRFGEHLSDIPDLLPKLLDQLKSLVGPLEATSCPRVDEAFLDNDFSKQQLCDTSSTIQFLDSQDGSLSWDIKRALAAARQLVLWYLYHGHDSDDVESSNYVMKWASLLGQYGDAEMATTYVLGLISGHASKPSLGQHIPTRLWMAQASLRWNKPVSTWLMAKDPALFRRVSSLREHPEGSEEQIRSMQRLEIDKNNYCHGMSYNLLHLAVRNGYIGLAESLIVTHGMDINMPTARERLTALMLAARCRNEDMLLTLLQSGADVRRVSRSGTSVLHELVAFDDDVAAGLVRGGLFHGAPLSTMGKLSRLCDTLNPLHIPYSGSAASSAAAMGMPQLFEALLGEHEKEGVQIPDWDRLLELLARDYKHALLGIACKLGHTLHQVPDSEWHTKLDNMLLAAVCYSERMEPLLTHGTGAENAQTATVLSLLRLGARPLRRM